MSNETTWAEIQSRNSDPREGRKETVVQFNIPKRERVLALKFLISKLRWERESFSDFDSQTINLLYDELGNRAETSRWFGNKFFFPLGKLRNWIRSMNLYMQGKLSYKVLWLLFPSEILDYILNRYPYFGMKFSEFKESPSFKYVRLYLRKTVQPFIGVGYRDKGSCRVSSWDGTPSLVEVLEDRNIRRTETVQYSLESPPDLFGEANECGIIVL